MAGAYGIVISTGNNINVEGLQDYRPVGAFSYLGRYRMVDFPVSNLSNSGIDRIQVYVSQILVLWRNIWEAAPSITLIRKRANCSFCSIRTAA